MRFRVLVLILVWGLLTAPVPAEAQQLGILSPATMRSERADALFVSGSPILNADRTRIIELAARHRLPARYQ